MRTTSASLSYEYVYVTPTKSHQNRGEPDRMHGQYARAQRSSVCFLARRAEKSRRA